MMTIQLKTIIHASIEDVFNLARDIDFHTESAKETKEKAIAGRTSGWIALNETVTWKGKHFGVYPTHQSKITSFKFPESFTDEMVKGNFKSFKHQHIFKTTSSGTEMTDVLRFQSPFGILGKIFDHLVLKQYLTQFLTSRNLHIKKYLETNIP